MEWFRILLRVKCLDLNVELDFHIIPKVMFFSSNQLQKMRNWKTEMQYSFELYFLLGSKMFFWSPGTIILWLYILRWYFGRQTLLVLTMHWRRKYLVVGIYIPRMENFEKLRLSFNFFKTILKRCHRSSWALFSCAELTLIITQSPEHSIVNVNTPEPTWWKRRTHVEFANMYV